MLLAGGSGTRLNILSSRRAKPAVPFGASYRIIDFTLSNVMHSGLERVGLLTQYKPFSLMDHVRGGEPWDLIGRERGIKVLPPYTGETESDWYKGTADAVWQNLWFMEDYKPEKVLILSGDHIYNMNYEAMISAHESRGADLTIATMEVPWEETSRFGVMTCGDDGRITGFVEKQKDAPSNLASMGVYVFDYRTLVSELKSVVANKEGFDFGHDVIPHMLGRRKLLAYPFSGYWRDVGTIKSYLDANMDCLDPSSGLDLRRWQICTNPDQPGRGDRPPVHIGSHGRVSDSLIAAGCRIDGEVEHCVLFPGVKVLPGARLTDSIVLNDCRVDSDCVVASSVLDKEVSLGPGARIGVGDPSVVNRRFPTHLDSGITVLGKQTVVSRGCRIGTNCIVFPGLDLGTMSVSKVPDGGTVEQGGLA
jgi:glucose-1-phosphate adenylyltransferase